jgi:hypothetical protein
MIYAVAEEDERERERERERSWVLGVIVRVVG